MDLPTPLKHLPPLFACIKADSQPKFSPHQPLPQNLFAHLSLRLDWWQENSQIGGKMSRIGDWNCRSCQHLNFQWRDSCQRCGDPRLFGDFASGGFNNNSRIVAGGSFSITGTDVRPGDWYCAVSNCGTHNFANRSTCFKCGALKDDPSAGCRFDFSRAYGTGGGSNGSGGRSGWKSGDWICTRFGCNEHNFASRTECFRCSAPRDYSANRLY